MKTNERDMEILKILETRKFTSVRNLSALLYTSPSSIRRSLNRLSECGLVERSYGGVILCDSEHTTAVPDVRLEKQKAEKQKIAAKAAALLRDGITVFLDISTTSSYLTEHLARFHGITVFTNNIRTAADLIERSVDAYCIGGHAKGGIPITVGDFAADMIAGVQADLFFFSSLALSDDGIVSDCSAEENAIRKLMLAHAQKKVFLCDSSKFHRLSTFRLCTLRDVDAFFTDEG